MKIFKLRNHGLSVIAMIHFDPEEHFIAGFLMLFLLFFGIFSIRRMLVQRFEIKSREKAHEKCHEYLQLACTLKKSQPEKKIAEGNATLPGYLPHQVYLKFTDKAADDPQCGGSLINEKFILTSARCVANRDRLAGSVLLGSLDKTNPDPKLWKKIKEIHIHPEFVAGSYSLHDISVLELEEKVEFTYYARPTCLNTKFKRVNPFIASGWGLDSEGNTVNEMRMIHLSMTDPSKKACIEMLSRDQWEKSIPKMICLGSLTGGEGVRRGDIGGPLSKNLTSPCPEINNRTWEQMGIISVGIGEFEESTGFLQIFTKVEYFVPWIVRIAWPETSAIF